MNFNCLVVDDTFPRFRPIVNAFTTFDSNGNFPVFMVNGSYNCYQDLFAPTKTDAQLKQEFWKYLSRFFHPTEITPAARTGCRSVMRYLKIPVLREQNRKALATSRDHRRAVRALMR